jgi:hypothetical protein
MAMQSDLLGAWALGVRSVMALPGDPLKVGPYEGKTKAVSDFDSVGLIRLVAEMNAGRLAAGEELSTPTGFCIVSAANPLVDSIQKLEQKLDAGVQCFQTNIVYDVGRFVEWFEPVVAAGIPGRAPFLVGVTPPRSTRMLEHLHNNVPGVEVDEATFSVMEGLAGQEAKLARLAGCGSRDRTAARRGPGDRLPPYGAGMGGRSRPQGGGAGGTRPHLAAAGAQRGPASKVCIGARSTEDANTSGLTTVGEKWPPNTATTLAAAVCCSSSSASTE